VPADPSIGVQFATFPETVVPHDPHFSFVRWPFEIGDDHGKLRLLEVEIEVCVGERALRPMFLDIVAAVGGKSRGNSPPHGRGDGAWP
jgi:hypothetical protein